MALQYTVRPVSDRSPFGGYAETSRFKVRWSQVLDLLEREYEALSGKRLVVEVDVPERAIRNDGTLRADARADSPAVRVAFDSTQGPLTFATDRFVRPSWSKSSMDDWQHNVYAIALGLEALRKVDRYGITQRGEQYQGWKALPAGTGAVATGMTMTEAYAVIARWAQVTEKALEVVTPPEREQIVRAAKIRAHPDKVGDRSGWNDLEVAISTLTRAGRR
jgi:hypothetical protein